MEDLKERIVMLTAMDVACGRSADPMRAKSLALVLDDVPLRWLQEAAKGIARTQRREDFPATAADIFREAWRAAGFRHRYNPSVGEDGIAYREPRMGEIQWWPVAPLAGVWRELADHWDRTAESMGLPAEAVLVAPKEIPESLPPLPERKGPDPVLRLVEKIEKTSPGEPKPTRRPSRTYASGAEFLAEWKKDHVDPKESS